VSKVLDIKKCSIVLILKMYLLEITIHVQKYLTDSLYAEQTVNFHEADSELEIKRKLVK
jgi:hypothetical protein